MVVTNHPVVREKSVLTDFIGFSSSGDPCCKHENCAHDGGLAVSKPGRFRNAQLSKIRETVVGQVQQ